MIESNFQYDSELIRELRRMALDGGQPADLIRCIQQKEGYAPDYIVPVLAYLRHTFGVPLRTILPLREEMGVGPESRALRVVFWFAAAMLADEECLPWDWHLFQRELKGDFNADDLAKSRIAMWATAPMLAGPSRLSATATKRSTCRISLFAGGLRLLPNNIVKC
jgi:hypothetical protein